MKIKCIDNKVSFLSKDILKDYPISYDTFSVTIGKEYNVYALGLMQGNIWYCIADDDNTFYPMWNPSPLFEIVDNRLSRHWVISLGLASKENGLLISFPEWANDPYFHGKLIDGNSNDQNAIILKKYKALMDLEFPDKSITEIAQIGDSDWLICPSCLDAWNCPNDQDGMVACPKCKKIMNNPRYRARLKSTDQDKN